MPGELWRHGRAERGCAAPDPVPAPTGSNAYASQREGQSLSRREGLRGDAPVHEPIPATADCEPPRAYEAAGAIGEREGWSAGNGQDECNPEIASDSALSDLGTKVRSTD